MTPGADCVSPCSGYLITMTPMTRIARIVDPTGGSWASRYRPRPRLATSRAFVPLLWAVVFSHMSLAQPAAPTPPPTTDPAKAAAPGEVPLPLQLAALIAEASDLVRWISQDVQIPEAIEPIPELRVTPRRNLEKGQAQIAVIAKLLAQPDASWESIPQDQRPKLGPIRAFRIVLRADALRLMSEGNYRESAERIVTQIDLARHFRNGGGAISSLGAESILTGASEDVERLLGMPGALPSIAEPVFKAYERLGQDSIHIASARASLRAGFAADEMIAIKARMGTDEKAALAAAIYGIDLEAMSEREIRDECAKAKLLDDAVAAVWSRPDAMQAIQKLNDRAEKGEFGELGLAAAPVHLSLLKVERKNASRWAELMTMIRGVEEPANGGEGTRKPQ